MAPCRSGPRVQPPHDAQCHLGQRRVLHIDADKVACRFGMLGQAGRNRLRQRGIESEPHLRQLHADVGVQFALGNRVQQPVIHVGCLVGFVCGGNALSE